VFFILEHILAGLLMVARVFIQANVKLHILEVQMEIAMDILCTVVSALLAIVGKPTQLRL
jgi:hypothetical protein